MTLRIFEMPDHDQRSLKFRTLVEKALPFPVIGDLFTWCPTMDLLTFAPNKSSMCLFRMSGQQVWRFNLNTPSVEITHVSWRPDG